MDYAKFDKLCKANGITPYQVSKDTGVRSSTLSAWKLGQYSPKPDKIRKIAEYFDVPLEYFYEETESVMPEGYYLSEETAKVAQEIFEDPDLRALFAAARDAKPEDLRMAAELLRRFKKTNDE